MDDAAGQTFDVIVVGSGASGGWAAKRLAEAGVKVGLLDAGRALTAADYTEHEPRLQAEVPERGPRGHPPHPARAEGLLRLHGVELRLVPQRPRGAVHHGRGEALLVAGAHEGGGGAHERLGAAELSLLRPRLQGRVLRRLRRGLAARSRRPRALLRHRRGLRRHHGDGRRASTSCPTRKFQPAMGMRCVERHVRNKVKDKLGWTLTLGRAANLTKPINGRQACHYCGPCERGCATKSLLQLRLHHGGRRPPDRQLHPRAERHGLQGADGSGRPTRREACSTSTA